MQLGQTKHSLIDCVKDISLITSSEALELAQDSNAEPSTSVHKIRVATKRLRATWYLLRSGQTQTLATCAINRLRNVARQLAAKRDKTVVKEVLADLSAGPLGLAEALPDPGLESARLIELLQLEHQTWLELEPGLTSQALITKNLRRTYRRARKLSKLATRKKSDYDLRHQWRKWVKYLYYQVDMLERCGLTGQHKLIANLDQLGEALGNEHDMYVLKKRIDSAKNEKTEAVLRELKQGLKNYRRQTRLLADKVFSRTPSQFLQYLHKKDRLFFSRL